MNQSPKTPIDDGIIDWTLALAKTYGWLLTIAIIVLVAIIFVFQRAVQHTTEKAIETAFSQQMKMFELAAGRRSAFVQQVQSDRWGAVNDFVIRIERIFTNINRFHHGHTVEGLVGISETGQIDIAPLTAVIEDLHGKRLLLGPDFHRLLWKRAEIALKFAQLKDSSEAPKAYKAVLDEKEENIREIENALEGVFQLSSTYKNE
jgi:hypothetical protein